jgi:flagellar motor switch protein FliM
MSHTAAADVGDRQWHEGAGPSIKRLDLTGRERQLRSAVLAMEKIGAAFARAARRSMPFLLRYRAQIVPGRVEVVADPGGASYSANIPALTIRVSSADGRARGSVTLNADAIAFVIEGALGGRGAFWRSPQALDLTIPQRALLSRITGSLAHDFCMAIRQEVGIELAEETGDFTEHTTQPGDYLRVTCALDGLPVAATIALTIGAEIIESAAKEQDAPEPVHGDPRLHEALKDVALTVVAELGRVSIGVGRVLSLKVGDVIRLPTATDDPIGVRIGGVEKLSGVPIVSRGQLSVEIRARHGG